MTALTETQVFKFLKNNQNSFWFQSVVSIIIFVLLNLSNIYYYFINPIIPGWDSVGHLAAGLYYADNIFPKTWGYIPNWYGGMAFPNFYPPLFFWILALVYKITSIPYIILIKTFSLLSLAIIPVLLLWISRTLYKTETIMHWVVVVFGAISISIQYSGLDPLIGINIKGLMHTGLLPYIFSFAIFLVFLRFALLNDLNKKNWLLSTIFLFLVLISNAHIAPVSVMFLGIIFLVKLLLASEEKQKISPVIYYYVSMGFIAALLAAFWYLPMFSDYSYLTSANHNDRTYVVKNFVLLTLPVMFISWFFMFKRKKDIYIQVYNWFLLIIIFLTIIRPAKLTSLITIHISRWPPVLFALFPIVAGYAVAMTFHFLSGTKKKIFLPILLCSLVFYGYIVLTDRYHMERPDRDDPYNINLIVEKLKNQPNIVLVEKLYGRDYSKFGSSLSNALESILGQNNIQTAWGILRESSTSSIFFTPMKNMFSTEKENFWAIKSYLNTKEIFKSDLNTKIERAKFMGIDKFVVASDEEYGILASSTKMSLEGNFGTWKIFSLNDPVKRAITLENSPVLLFSDINFKNREINDYNYSRFQELVIEKAAFDITFVAPQKKYIEDENLQNFSVIVIDDYIYKNEDEAFKKLSEFSQKNTLIIYRDVDPLFSKLDALPKNKFHIYNFERIQQRFVIKNLIGDQADELFALIRANNTEISEERELTFNIENNKIKIDFSVPTKKPVPVLIKSSFFPMWKTSIGTNRPVYMATPAFMLVYADDDFQLEFQPSLMVYVGYLISALTALVMIVLYRRSR